MARSRSRRSRPSGSSSASQRAAALRGTGRFGRYPPATSWPSTLRPARDRARWQRVWGHERTWEVSNDPTTGRRASYVLEMLPYPWGEPHIGHLKVYSVGDAVAHFHRRTGSACCTRWATTRSGCRPRTTRSRPVSTRATRPRTAIEAFQRAVPHWGISIDWSREFGTHEPRYYRWTQWNFLQLHQRGLAYRKEAAVKWCPTTKPCSPTSRSSTGAAGGAAPRSSCGSSAVVLPHHRLRRPAARRSRHDRLAGARQDDAAQLDRPLRGRRGHVPLEPRSGIDYPVFTTRPDTLFGATFFVMAPEHPDVVRARRRHRARAGVHEYITSVLTKPRSATTPTEEDRRVARAHA